MPPPTFLPIILQASKEYSEYLDAGWGADKPVVTATASALEGTEAVVDSSKGDGEDGSAPANLAPA